MESFIFDRKKHQIEFESYLIIKKTTLLKADNSKNSWTSILSSIELSSELKHKVCSDYEGRFIEDRTLQSPIVISVAPHQIQPVF